VFNFKKTKKTKKDKLKQFNKLKKNAPKIPDFTCPWIDDVIGRIQKIQEEDKPITRRQLNVISQKMERLRNANDKLRDSGIYWYEQSKKLLDIND
jgi:hypothetical protein